VSAAALLRAVSARLESLGIPFMLTGSVAAAFHGAGRATMDVDLVIDATSDQLRALVASLAALDLYVSADVAMEALARESMFNVVDATTGWKADLIIRKSRPFSRGEFARRRALVFEGTALWVATVEDLIVAKLEWAKLGASSRQIEDVTAMLRVAAGALDRVYLDRWVAELDLAAQWQAVQTALKGE
jgi:hypothetical protein